MESNDRSKKSFERKDHQPSAGKSKGREISESELESGERFDDHEPQIGGSGEPTGQPADHKSPKED
mgnify:CR=1 FL=1